VSFRCKRSSRDGVTGSRVTGETIVISVSGPNETVLDEPSVRPSPAVPKMAGARTAGQLQKPLPIPWMGAGLSATAGPAPLCLI
jgi:hypothetical protein